MSRRQKACGLIPALVICIAATAILTAQSRRPSNSNTSFDYYVLSLSWAPAFCEQPGDAAANPQECSPGRMIGFIVHGLWPETASGKSPEFCGQAKPVPKDVVNYVIRYMPSPNLIQHEWAAHGVCTGLTPNEYFGAIIEMRAAVQLPVQFSSLDKETRETPGQIETQFAAANPAFPQEAFRTACARGQLQEERICFDKNRKPRACTENAGECRDLSVIIRPPL